MTPPPAVSDALPCDVALVVKQHCVDCHGSMLRRGATVHLTTAAEFRLPWEGMTVGAIALARVQNDMRPMPPVGPRLNATEIMTLLSWVNAGAPGATPGCPVEDPSVAAPLPEAGTTTMVPGAKPDAGATVPPTPKPDGGTTTVPTIDAGPVTGDAAVPVTQDPTQTMSANWSMFGHDLNNTRTNPTEHTISAANAKSLHRVWEFKGPASTSTPAIVDGTVYLPGWDGKVRALRAEDGGVVWTSEALPNMVDTAQTVIDSSPVVTATMIYVSDNNGCVHALDRASGKRMWTVVVDKDGQAHLWSSPIYIQSADQLVVGVASGEEQEAEPTGGYTFRGSVVGLAAADGHELWRTHTADAPAGPGVAVWSTAAVDLTRKAVYIGTGNNYAAPSSKLEDSLLAIDYTTGSLIWSTQFTKDDLFTIFTLGSGPDSDIGSTANLFSVGGMDLVGVGIKNGAYAALERDTGMVHWSKMLTAGSSLGGVISASAYADGTIYVASNNGMTGTTLFALNAMDGTIRWMSAAEPALTYGGVSYANGVVYWATEDGEFMAIDASTGKELFRDQASDSIAGSPSVANGMVFVPWGYQWTLLDNGIAGTGGMLAYAP